MIQLIKPQERAVFLFFGVLLSLIIFSCSSKPIEYYPNRKTPAPPPTHTGTGRTNIEPKYTTETITDSGDKTYSSTNPYGFVTKSPGASGVVHSPEASSDWLNYLRTQLEKKKSAEDIILNRLSSVQLETASRDVAFVNYKPLILWQLAQLYYKNKRPAQAIENFKLLSSEFPQHHLATQAKSTLFLLEASQSVESNTVGVILPLTGKNASIGQHALNAIRIALGLNRPDPKYKLAVFDTQSNPDSAASGFEKLLVDDRPIAIIGGLSAKEATLVAQRAELFSVPFIALTQKPGITQIGEYIFRNALTPEMQVSALVDYAFNKLGAKKFAVLFPNDSYGSEFANSYWDQVLARGGQITAAQTYDPKENDFSTIIQKMVGTYYPEARPEEYKARLDELKNSKKERARKRKDRPVVKNSREHENEDSVLLPLVDFDVLFVPDSGRVLSQVMAFMKVAEVGELTYLGTNIWNSPDIVKRTHGQKDRVYFVDALNPNDTSIRETAFFKDYLAEYNEEPTLIEMQAFEAAKVLREVMGSSTSRDGVASRLRILGRSSGVTGELRMTNYRELERPVHVLNLESGLVNKVN